MTSSFQSGCWPGWRAGETAAASPAVGQAPGSPLGSAGAMGQKKGYWRGEGAWPPSAQIKGWGHMPRLLAAGEGLCQPVPHTYHPEHTPNSPFLLACILPSPPTHFPACLGSPRPPELPPSSIPDTAFIWLYSFGDGKGSPLTSHPKISPGSALNPELRSPKFCFSQIAL